MNTTTKTMLAAAVLAAAPVMTARAADVPGSRSTTAAVRVSAATVYRGTFEQAGDSDWYRLSLAAGHEYAFGGAGDGLVNIELRNQGGVLLCSGESSDGTDGGCWMRAAYDGAYYLALTDLGGSQRTPPYPGGYWFSVAPDCADDGSTSCRIKVGGTKQKYLTWSADCDRFATRLAGGSSYTAASDEVGTYVDFRDAGGSVVAAVFGARTVSYTAATTGRYFVEVCNGNDLRVPYHLSLASGSASPAK